MKYKACILAAGVGNRIGNVTDSINNALLPVNFKATISHIIEKFDKSIEIVIAVGHKKETVMDYVSLAHPERKITYVQIKDYMGPGSGPGLSLLECKKHLECPFVFFTADTLVLEEVPAPDKNWFGIAPVKKTEEYSTVKIKNNLVSQIDDKIKTDNKYAFIGLAGVKDYDKFWNALENDSEIKKGEIQVSNGFNALIEQKLVPTGFTWFDTGSEKNYIETNKNFLGNDEDFDFSKSDEFIYFVNGRIVKYFANEDITNKRVERAKLLKDLCPQIENKKGGFYSYKKVPGQVIYDVVNIQILNDFLQWAKSSLWKKKELNKEDQKAFDEACKKFYYDKTMERLGKFYAKTGVEDTTHIINGVQVPPLKDLLAQIDWEDLYQGTPSNYHGDFQFDNVLYTKDSKNLSRFTILDWRQDFGGIVEHADMYYDLGKLNGGMNISYKSIKKNEFDFDMSGNSVFYKYQIDNNLMEAKEEYHKFLVKNGFNLKKVKIITGIIFLNMSPMHHSPFDRMIYFMGKLTLYRALHEEGLK